MTHYTAMGTAIVVLLILAIYLKASARSKRGGSSSLDPESRQEPMGDSAKFQDMRKKWKP